MGIDKRWDAYLTVHISFCPLQWSCKAVEWLQILCVHTLGLDSSNTLQVFSFIIFHVRYSDLYFYGNQDFSEPKWPSLQCQSMMRSLTHGIFTAFFVGMSGGVNLYIPSCSSDLQPIRSGSWSTKDYPQNCSGCPESILKSETSFD